MIPACLVKRYLGTSQKKRGRAYWYLSRRVDGRTVLRYVKLAELDKIKRGTGAWREYSAGLREWVKINRQIEKLLQELGRLQSEEYNG